MMSLQERQLAAFVAGVSVVTAIAIGRMSLFVPELGMLTARAFSIGVGQGDRECSNYCLRFDGTGHDWYLYPGVSLWKR